MSEDLFSNYGKLNLGENNENERAIPMDIIKIKFKISFLLKEITCAI